MKKLIIAAAAIALAGTGSATAHAQEESEPSPDIPIECSENDLEVPEGVDCTDFYTEEEIGAAGTATTCIDDIPTVTYSIDTTGFTPDPPVATLTITDINGDPIDKYPTVDQSTFENVPLSGEFPFPGVRVEDGRAVDWPGWRFDEATQSWVEDPTDALLRQGINILMEVNPSTTVFVSYPTAPPDCVGPGEDDESTTNGQLPRTGSDGTNTLLQGGAVLLAGGALLLLVTRRRRQATVEAT